MKAKALSVWQIDGEDLIVAGSERDMRAVYLDYHGETIRGHDRRLILPTEVIDLEDADGDVFSVLAKDYVETSGRGYYAAMR